MHFFLDFALSKPGISVIAILSLMCLMCHMWYVALLFPSLHNDAITEPCSTRLALGLASGRSCAAGHYAKIVLQSEGWSRVSACVNTTSLNQGAGTNVGLHLHDNHIISQKSQRRSGKWFEQHVASVLWCCLLMRVVQTLCCSVSSYLSTACL